MKLSEQQINKVWQLMFEAEVRSFYFGDLASRYTKRKQLISGIAFFLSSGAAAALIGRAPAWVPIVLSLVTASLTAYSIAVGLDKKSAAMTKLHSSWNRLNADFERLWEHWYEDNADEILHELMDRSIDLSEAGTEAPYEPALLDKWGKVARDKYTSAA